MVKTKNIESQKHERYFFDIPVFRCDEETHYRGNENKKHKLAQNIAGKGKEVTQREITFAEDWLWGQRSSYHYGEIVGMIRLFAISGQIRAELWFVKERVSSSLKNKTWRRVDSKLFEHLIFGSYKNNDIFSWILTRLKEENKKSYLKGRYIDVEAFEQSGKYINYYELVNFPVSEKVEL